MVQILLIGLGAGAAAGLLFASVASGSVLSMLLFWIAPLPILIAALGWSHWAGLVAALTGALGLAIAFRYSFALTFLVWAGLPGWVLGYLALLARPSDSAPGGAEWYPPGRLVVWAAVFGSLLMIAAIPIYGLDEESFRAGLRQDFQRMLRVETATPPATPAPAGTPAPTDLNRLINVLVVIMPVLVAVIGTITNIINLWLSARIVKFSGRLQRPWPDFTAMTFPNTVPVVLALAITGAMLPRLIGAPSLVSTIASVIAASLLIAYGALGFAVLHAITIGRSNRVYILAGAYAAVGIFGWPLLALTLLGLADGIFDIRGRVASKRGPPPQPQT